MILLDTNIISEVMRRKPSDRVLGWLNLRNKEELFVSSITIAEICYGLRILPVGQRKKQLETHFEQFIAQGFTGRIIGFDESAARVYAEIMGLRKEKGRPMSLPDGQIAAVARSNNLALATRNIRDFGHCEIELINPFE
ncbi:MAG: type II toxin-antitoxin system VapC family toxin [Candidatus Electrothrix sp. Rat3]|uniref:PIN domain-containing protein n=1 Tax=Candidatus Electrothrix sp. TaxID=2170559 RepID=UPI00291BE8BC|nr:type II toxin-antitoxin system VapC family toxin [Candidatus Electrothrix rattekaaiensis]